LAAIDEVQLLTLGQERNTHLMWAINPVLLVTMAIALGLFPSVVAQS
jgi:hypothetical protein